MEDLANLMDILVDPSRTDVPAGGYINAVTAAWEGLKIGALNPDTWTFPESARKLEPAAEIQMVKNYICNPPWLTSTDRI